MSRGKIIVFEGLDYSFKETNSKKLVEWIKNNITDKVIHLSFPTYDSESSFFVKNYLKGTYGTSSDLDPYTTSYFYALNRFHTINELKIKEKLDDGYYIIMDRYTGSNMIFQSCKFDSIINVNEYLRWDEMLEYEQLNLPKQDLTIFMNMPIEVSFPLMKERKYKNGESEDGHEDNFRFMKKVEENAFHVCEKLNYKIINCTNDNNTIRSEEDLFNEILFVCKKLLSK